MCETFPDKVHFLVVPIVNSEKKIDTKTAGSKHYWACGDDNNKYG